MRWLWSDDFLVEVAEDALGPLFSNSGEVNVDEGLIEAGVAEIGADVTKAHTFVQEVGGVAVPEGVGSDALFEM